MVSHTSENLVPVELLTVASQIAVAILEPGRDLIEQGAFDAAANSPAIERLSVAHHAGRARNTDLGAHVLIPAACIDQRLSADEISGSCRKVEGIVGVDRYAITPDIVAGSDVEASLEAQHDIGRHGLIIAHERAADEAVLLVVDRSDAGIGPGSID